MNHEHQPQAGSFNASRCTVCGKVIIRGSKGWRIKPKGHS